MRAGLPGLPGLRRTGDSAPHCSSLEQQVLQRGAARPRLLNGAPRAEALSESVLPLFVFGGFSDCSASPMHARTHIPSEASPSSLPGSWDKSQTMQPIEPGPPALGPGSRCSSPFYPASEIALPHRVCRRPFPPDLHCGVWSLGHRLFPSPARCFWPPHLYLQCSDRMSSARDPPDFLRRSPDCLLIRDQPGAVVICLQICLVSPRRRRREGVR